MLAILAVNSPHFFSLPLAISDWAAFGLVVVAAALGMALVKLLDYLRKRDADKEAAQIIERAESEAATRRKEAAVEAREMALQEKARLESENEVVRQELHERGRKLDKSEDAITTRADQLAKQEDGREQPAPALRKLDDATRARRSSTTCSTSNGRPCTSSAA
jgi:hypothetical protein